MTPGTSDARLAFPPLKRSRAAVISVAQLDWQKPGDGQRQRTPGIWPDLVTGLLPQASLSQIFAAAASFAGSGGHFLRSSVIADPYGHRVAAPLTRDQEEMATARAGMSATVAAHRSRSSNPGRTDTTISTESNTEVVITKAQLRLWREASLAERRAIAYRPR